MELLQKISIKYLSLPFTALMLTMSVVSCDSNCSGTTEGEKGELKLSFEKGKLQGADKKTKLSIKATKATKLAGLKLIANLKSTTVAPAPAGTVNLTVAGTDLVVTIGTDFRSALYTLLGLGEGEDLAEGDNKSIDITFNPTTEKELTLIVEVKNDKDEVVGSAETVEWEDSAVVLEVASDKATITDKESATITITNNSGVAIIPHEVEVILNATNGVSFDLGQAKGNNASQTLAAILGNDTAIDPSQTATFTIQYAAGARKASALSLTMKHNGKIAFTTAKVVSWKDSAVVLRVASDKATITDKESATITVTNNSAVDVKPSDVAVVLNVDNESEFKLGNVGNKKDSDSVNLAAILGHDNVIKAGSSVTFEVLVSDPKANKESALSFTITHKGKEAFATAKVVAWSKEVVALEVTKDKDIIGAKKATITVTNNSAVDVKPSDVAVVLNVDNDSEFKLGNAGNKKDSDSVDLAAILGHDNVIKAGSSVTFEVLVSDPKANKKSDLSFTMTHKGKEAFATARVVEWIES